MSLHALAHQVQSAGRGDDTVLVHMTPGEVKGLHALAVHHGGGLTINPHTGLPEAGFLTTILPMIAGAVLAPFTGGMSAALLVGGGMGLYSGIKSGSVTKGLMDGLTAGLGAYGGAGIAEGLMGAGAKAAARGAASAGLEAAPGVFGTAGKTIASQGLTTAAGTAEATAAREAAGQIPSSAARGVSLGGGPSAPGTVPQITPALVTPAQPSIYKSLESTTAKLGQGIKDAAKTGREAYSQMGQGLQKVTSISPEGTAARSQLWDTSKYPIMAAGASSMLSPSSTSSGRAPIDPNAPTAKFDPNYQAYRTYDPSARAPDSSSERMYYAKDGGLMSLAVGGPANGPVQQMSNQNAIGANTGYPMAADSTPSYSVASANPISENIIRPQGDSNVDPYTGAERFANGGMVSTLRGLLGNAMPQAY